VTDVKVRQERQPDRRQVRQVVQATFRSQPVVADLVEACAHQPGGAPACRWWPGARGGCRARVASRGWLDAQAQLVDVLILSPLSVTPGRQGQPHKIPTDTTTFRGIPRHLS
jgi:predicted N-acetyltransferase YhbS